MQQSKALGAFFCFWIARPGALALARFKENTMINVQLPDGSVRSFEQAVTIAEVAANIGPGLAKATLAGKVDGKLVDADLCWHCCVCHVLSRSQGLRANLPGIAKTDTTKTKPAKRRVYRKPVKLNYFSFTSL